MTDLRKAAEMALEFVSWFASDDHSIRPKHKAPEIKEALHQALAEDALKKLAEIDHSLGLFIDSPEREWVGLTDDERSYYLQAAANVGWWQAALFVENKLKEKNT